MNRLPVAGLAAPARRVSGPCLFVEGVTSVEDRGVVAGMTFGRCHEPDPTVSMLVVVPAYEGLHPVPRYQQGATAVPRVGGASTCRGGPPPTSMDGSWKDKMPAPSTAERTILCVFECRTIQAEEHPRSYPTLESGGLKGLIKTRIPLHSCP